MRRDAKRDERDRYFMALARAVRGRDNVSGGDDEQPAHAPHHGANCYGSKIGAVLVLGDRVISTGYNGTPAGMLNCIDGGCLRCKDRYLEKLGQTSKMSDPSHTAGAALDRCICVHAEQNALLAAARFGTRVEGATLYTTLSPCFGCLKESIQAGVARIVYETKYQANYSEQLQAQYDGLAEHLRGSSDQRHSENFEALGGDPTPPTSLDAGPDPYASPS